MNNNQQVHTNMPVASHDELILVVKRNKIFAQEQAWHGLKQVDSKNYLDIIDKEKEFLPRSLMEQDPAYKQIIPYLIFEHDNSYFLMQRRAQATEQRLKNKYSLGIGGHIRQEDLSSNNIIDWAKREFEEEVDFTGNYCVEPLGILNDDTNSVGQVHIGFVFLLRGDTNKICVKSELKSGQLLTLAQLEAYYNSMEAWTQIVFDYLKATRL